MKEIKFNKFDDCIYYDEKLHAFYDSHTTLINVIEGADDEFIEMLRNCDNGQQVISLLSMFKPYSLGNTAEDVLYDWFENDINEASFGDLYSQAIVDELNYNLETKDEEGLIYTYSIVKIGETLAIIGE